MVEYLSLSEDGMVFRRVWSDSIEDLKASKRITSCLQTFICLEAKVLNWIHQLNGVHELDDNFGDFGPREYNGYLN